MKTQNVLSWLVVVVLGILINSLAARTIPNQIGNKILLYQVSSEESLRIIDKANRISVLDNKQLTEAFDPAETNKQDWPHLYALLHSTDSYMLIGTRNALFNISLSNLNSQLKVNFWIDKKNSNCYFLLNDSNFLN